MKITVDIESGAEFQPEWVELQLNNLLESKVKVTEHHCKLTEDLARKLLKEITWRYDGILFAATIERWKLKEFITEASNEDNKES